MAIDKPLDSLFSQDSLGMEPESLMVIEVELLLTSSVSSMEIRAAGPTGNRYTSRVSTS